MHKPLLLALFIIFIGCGTSTEREDQILSLDSLNSQAWEHITRKQYDSAYQKFKSVLARDSSNYDANFALIEVHLIREEYSRAYELADSLIEIYPDWIWFQHQKGQAIEQLASVDSALHYYNLVMDSIGYDLSVDHFLALTAITEQRPLTVAELDSFDIESISQRNELLNYSNGGWFELHRFSQDTVLFYETNLGSIEAMFFLKDQNFNVSSVVGAEGGVRVHLKRKFVKLATEFGLTQLPENQATSNKR